MDSINNFIGKQWDDKVFFFAERMEYNPTSGWHIEISPQNCLVGMKSYVEGMPAVNTLRSESLEITKTNESLLVEGRILLSSGVILFVGNQVLLFERDEHAPTDPLRWTSPAGRSDREPLLTGLKEFHEEVIFYDGLSNRPIYIDIESNPYSQEVEAVYQRTLKSKGLSEDADDWIRLNAKISTEKIENLNPVSTSFGNQLIDTSLNNTLPFFSFLDEHNSTLELLLPLSLIADTLDNIKIEFCDGEYQRETRLFTISELKELPPAKLVSTMVDLKSKLVNQ